MTALMARLRTIERGEITVLASRMISFGIGPLTVLAVGTFLTPVMQGYYYSFSSVVAASLFFEAGISTAIVQIAAHEAARLRVGLIGVEGEDSLAMRRLSGVFRFAIGWYWVIAALMLVCITGAGVLLFSAQKSDVLWLLPWILLVTFASVDFALQPFFVMLEGTAQIVHVYRYRIIRTVVQNSVLIVSVALGLGLYALALASAAAVLVALANILPARRFFRSLLHVFARGSISWRTEIFPFQWRIAVSWMAGYFSASLFTPLLLATRGPTEAGQMGMTMMLTSACTALAASLMLAQAPVLGALAGGARWQDLIALFKRKAVRSIAIAFVLLTTACFVVWLAQLVGVPLASRVLPAWAFAPFALGILVYHVEGVFAFFMRAQKREPYFVLEVVGAVIILPAAVLVAPVAGAAGVAAVFAAVHLVVLLPFATVILRRSMRSTWRMPTAPAAVAFRDPLSVGTSA